MCTVTYIPTEEKSYILTSNRDESPLRGSVTILPQLINRSNINLLSPIDEKAKGTWLLTTEKGTTLCILNGAFTKHKHQPPYAYSRGLIPFKYLDYKCTGDFLELVDLDGVEPFTLIICENGNKLSTLIWDEKEKHISELNANKSYIWSSATLYDDETKKYKEELFHSFLDTSKKPINSLEFHQIGIDKIKEPSVFIKREKVETVSTTVVNVSKKEAQLFYQDYLKNKSNKLSLQLNKV